MPELWNCPLCGRVFRRPHQRHSCGAGSRVELLEGKPPGLAKLYTSLDRTVRAWPGVEIVYRGRYVLMRTTRIFADLVFMRDALRVAIVLEEPVKKPFFFKVGPMAKHRVAHVALLQNAADLAALL